VWQASIGKRPFCHYVRELEPGSRLKENLLFLDWATLGTWQQVTITDKGSLRHPAIESEWEIAIIGKCWWGLDVDPGRRFSSRKLGWHMAVNNPVLCDKERVPLSEDNGRHRVRATAGGLQPSELTPCWMWFDVQWDWELWAKSNGSLNFSSFLPPTEC
jgi:hypothetical protein